MNPLQIEFKAGATPRAFSLQLVGVLDDNADFGAVLAAFQKTPPRELRVDLEGVGRTNSVGIREWLLFLDRLPVNCALIFEKVSHSFLEQANMVPNLLGNASPVRLLSFQIPEVCTKCEKTSVRTLTPIQVQLDGTHWAYPTVPCAACGSAVELDALESEYFQFLKRGVKG